MYRYLKKSVYNNIGILLSMANLNMTKKNKHNIVLVNDLKPKRNNKRKEEVISLDDEEEQEIIQQKKSKKSDVIIPSTYKTNYLFDAEDMMDVDEVYVQETPITYEGYRVINEYSNRQDIPTVNVREYYTTSNKVKTMPVNKHLDVHTWNDEEYKKAFNGYAKKHVSFPKYYKYSLDNYFKNSINKIGKTINDSIYKYDNETGENKFYSGQKVALSYQGMFYKWKDKEQTIKDRKEFWFNSEMTTFLNKNDVTVEKITKMLDYIKEQINEFCGYGSGWIFEYNIQLQVNAIKYSPLKGKSYIKLPEWVSNKKKAGIINIKNDDNKCFIYSCRAFHLEPKKNAERVKQYMDDKLQGPSVGTLEYPIEATSSAMKYLEKINQDYAFNIFSFDNDKKEFYSVVETAKKCKYIINLLYWQDGNNGHYGLIKNINALKYDDENRHVQYTCTTCLHGFRSEETLIYHRDVLGCSKFGQAVVMPKEEKAVYKFTQKYKQFRAPFIFYCDFESITEKINEGNKYQIHRACSYQIYRVSTNPMYNKLYPVVKSDDSSKLIRQYIDDIIMYGDDVLSILQTSDNKVTMTNTDYEIYNKSTTCYLCDKIFEDDKVRDHDNLTGKFRGAACNKCNIAEKTRDIPVVFHNLKGYDSHLILKEYHREDRKVECIAQSSEKYLSFKIGKLKFIDSFQFLSTSLEKLVYSLIDAPKDESENYYDYEKLSEEQKNNVLSKIKMNCLHTLNHLNLSVESDREKVLLITQKGVYPYDYMDNFNKFNDVQLPLKEEFFSKLDNKDISNEDYERAQKVWKTFNLKSMHEYHDLYLNTDILLLADVFENFRTLTLNQKQLDPAHYYTLPGLAMDSAVKKFGSGIDLFTDYNMYLLTERGIRGGISTMMRRYAKANNKYIEIETTASELIKSGIKVNDYINDPNEKKSYIIYLDANNLYGWSMVQYLPTGNYKWVEPTEFDVDKIMNLKDDANTGYLFEVDLTYPKELHNLHNDYPLAPESLEVKYNMLSDYNKQKLAKMGKKFTKGKKLVPNLNDKKNYVLHYRNLKLYISLGLKLTKIHHIISFDQKPWLADYINENTELRKNSKSDFEKDFYKLMNNAVFGKTMENVRNRIDYKLINNEKYIAYQVSKPLFNNPVDIFHENFIGISVHKPIVELNKPIIVGFAILELSKLHMYNFHYNIIKKQFGDRAKLLMTDTDSLVYHIETEDVYEELKEFSDLFDTSNFPKNHPFFSNKNKKVIGKFKFETGEHQILEFVGLRSKLYSFVLANEEVKKAKGVKKSFVKQELTFESYKKCLFSELLSDMEQTVSFNVIRSKLHTVYSETVTKIGLCCTDDKRYILGNGIETLAYGHKDI